MNLAIVKYNAGNVCSVVNAFRRLGVEPLVTDVADELTSADRVVFPGQGEASSAMEYLKAHRLDEVIVNLKQPLLGICIGMQLLCRHSEEGDTKCLGVFDVDVKRFQPKSHNEKVPQMGWNSLSPVLSTAGTDGQPTVNPLFNGLQTLSEGMEEALPFVYFIHSYYVPICQETIGTTDYIQPYSSALHKDNFYATQFHPEKSGRVGEQILRNFLNLSPAPLR